MQFFQQRYNFTQDRTINENEIYLILLKSCLCVYKTFLYINFTTTNITV